MSNSEILIISTPIFAISGFDLLRCKLSFILKEGDSTKPVAIESEQTAGSNNFFNSYNAVGGTSGKIHYYAYYDYRGGDGWRNDADFKYHAYYANFQYNFNSKGSLAFQFS